VRNLTIARPDSDQIDSPILWTMVDEHSVEMEKVVIDDGDVRELSRVPKVHFFHFLSSVRDSKSSIVSY
jgi:hypothetical protein